MTQLFRYLGLYVRFLSQSLKAAMEYRLDFWLGVLANLAQQLVGLLFLSVLFSQFPQINGWSVYEMAFLYGLATIPAGLCELFLNAPWYIPWRYVYEGRLDTVLVRPINALFHAIADQIGAHGLGLVILGTAVLATASAKLGFVWTPAAVAYTLLAITSGTLIYFSINLIGATFSFWLTTNMSPMMLLVHQLNGFTRYPITIFPKVVQVVLSWIVPFAFTGFYPAAFLLGREGFGKLALATPLVAAVLFTVAYAWWSFGLRRYQSTGS